MPDQIENLKIICAGGLNSNENHLDLSDNEPGVATRLVNFEPSLFGGYRRISGYELYNSDFPEVGAGGMRLQSVKMMKRFAIQHPIRVKKR